MGLQEVTGILAVDKILPDEKFEINDIGRLVLWVK
jgi:hypothetical protein